MRHPTEKIVIRTFLVSKLAGNVVAGLPQVPGLPRLTLPLWSLTQWPHLKSVDKTLPGFFQDYLMIFADLFYHGFQYVNDCLSKYAKLGKIWRLVTSGDLNFGLEKIWPELFRKNFVRAIEHFFRFSLQCLKPPAPARFRASWSPPGIGLRHLGIPRYVSTVDIQVLTSYLLEMQNLSKIKKWQSTVTATAKKR